MSGHALKKHYNDARPLTHFNADRCSPEGDMRQVLRRSVSVLSGVPLKSSVLVLILIFPASPDAQTITGALRGIVMDASGAVLPGALVELSGAAQIGGVQSTTADQNGQFRFQNLNPGTYSMKASLLGFK